ncbi:HSP90 family protein [Cytophagaceae bacterium DM2B3-1]|uniref:HSP90 family protein n=1 Tax=Xanthocytophaga flava TaxID=3048013 RepID=A0ABT7CJD6_9BACT|nr:HSP90 family protein [Xanthocytophaga flavus]MDJ1493846.1 HSP90 family protein [Xanthocytophaga flavus]
MENSIFQVNLSGILKVLSDSLYSSWEVFIRELLQNANDAITARGLKESFKPVIQIDFFETGTSRVLQIKDNGIGLTADEMTEFLSKIGSSSKRNTSDMFDREQQSFIGQFGIGLLSCFMVSEKIEVESTAWNSTSTMRWIGNTDGTYAIEPTDYNGYIGTKVRLAIKKDIALTSDKLTFLLHKYGDYLPVPIKYSYNAGSEITFQKEFPWLTRSTGSEALMLGNRVFGERFSHYFPIQDSKGQTQGLAYVLPHRTHTTSVSKHVLYVKRMFISDSCGDILPDWAFFVRAILNSDNLSTTASREDIYHNEILEEVRESLGISIKKYLKRLGDSDPEAMQEIIVTHAQALKSLALEDDDFFAFIKNWFIFPTTQGDLSLKQIQQQSSSILFVSDLDEFRQIAPIARANNQLVINAGYIYDTPILLKLQERDHTGKTRQINPEYFGNILNDIDIEIYDLIRKRIDVLQAILIEFDVELDIKAFSPEHVPAMLHMSQDSIQKRDFKSIRDESDSLWAGVSDAILDFDPGFRAKLFLNYKNEIVKKLLYTEASKKIDPYIQMLYFNALMMGHYPLSGKELDRMNENIMILLNTNL